jgi:hypothetical protein
LKFIGGTVARCGVLIAVVIAAASWGLKPSYPWMISSAVCATGVYGVGSWFFVFNRREREQLQSLVSNRIQKQTELAPLEVGVH